MRRLGMVIVLTATVGCSRAGECQSSTGVDEKVPVSVRTELQKNGMTDFQLIDKVSCDEEIYWTAIPSGVPPDVPRPPGLGRLVVLDLKTGTVAVYKGQ